MSRVAILGWGSLIYHPEGDPAANQKPLESVGKWRLEGPILPLEYSRISDNKRLTLVIDPENGCCNRVFVVESALTTLAAAKENLRSREGTKRLEWIGTLERSETVIGSNQRAELARWLAATEFDAVIWTAIPSRFSEKVGEPFTPTAAVQYLQRLQGDERLRAYRYIVETPDEISTEVRKNARWPEAVAVHEAGHFVLACLLGREPVRLSRIEVPDVPGKPPTVGLRCQDCCSSVVLAACAFGGPWAELLYHQDSVASWKRSTFQQGILRPSAEEKLYSATGWQHDIAQAKGARIEGIERLDQQVGTFLRRPSAASAIRHVADDLVKFEKIEGAELGELRQEIFKRVAQAESRATVMSGF